MKKQKTWVDYNGIWENNKWKGTWAFSTDPQVRSPFEYKSAKPPRSRSSMPGKQNKCDICAKANGYSNAKKNKEYKVNDVFACLKCWKIIDRYHDPHLPPSRKWMGWFKMQTDLKGTLSAPIQEEINMTVEYNKDSPVAILYGAGENKFGKFRVEGKIELSPTSNKYKLNCKKFFNDGSNQTDSAYSPLKTRSPRNQPGHEDNDPRKKQTKEKTTRPETDAVSVKQPGKKDNNTFEKGEKENMIRPAPIALSDSNEVVLNLISSSSDECESMDENARKKDESTKKKRLSKQKKSSSDEAVDYLNGQTEHRGVAGTKRPLPLEPNSSNDISSLAQQIKKLQRMLKKLNPSKILLISDYELLRFPQLGSERPDRIIELWDLCSSFAPEDVDFVSSVQNVPLSLLYRTHDSKYLQNIFKNFSSHKEQIESSLKSAGVVYAAVERMLDTWDLNEKHTYSMSLCLVRPPGHGTGRDKRYLCSKLCRNYFNPCAIGAVHAASKGNKVAVLDIGLHLGCGTCDIVYHMLKNNGFEMFFASAYVEDPSLESWELERPHVAIELVNVQTKKEWSDANQNLIQSIQTFSPDIIFCSVGSFGANLPDGDSLVCKDFQAVFDSILKLKTKTVFILEDGCDFKTVDDLIKRMIN